MKSNKSKTVSFIYFHTNNSQTFISFRPRLEARLDRAIADMFEDGFDTFIVSVDNNFGLLAAAAVVKAKEQNPEIKLIIFPYQDDYTCFNGTPEECEELKEIRKRADNMLYLSSAYTNGVPLDLHNFLFNECHGVILYYEKFAIQAMRMLYRAHRTKKIVINLSIFV